MSSTAAEPNPPAPAAVADRAGRRRRGGPRAGRLQAGAAAVAPVLLHVRDRLLDHLDHHRHLPELRVRPGVLGPGRDLDLADRRRRQHDDRPGRGRTRHPHPAGRLRLPVERPAGEPHLRLVRRLRRAALHGRRRRRDHARGGVPAAAQRVQRRQPEPAPGAHGGDHPDAAAGRDQHHQHPGRGAGQQRRGVHRDHRDRGVRRAAVRALGRARQAHAVRRRHPVSTPRPSSTTRPGTPSRWPACSASSPWSGSSSPPTCPRTRSTRCAACRAACCGPWAARWSWA